MIQPYAPAEIQAMLKVCELDYQQGAKFLASRNRAIILILLDSGLRLTELSSMKVTDIDTNSGWIKVQGKGGKERSGRNQFYLQNYSCFTIASRPTSATVL